MTSFFKSLLILIPLLILTTAFTGKKLTNDQPINKVFDEEIKTKIKVDSPFDIINNKGNEHKTNNNKIVKQHQTKPKPTIQQSNQKQVQQPKQQPEQSYKQPEQKQNQSSLPNEEQIAKQEIANAESTNSYTAVNGRYYGKYQLDISYLHGDLSPENQEIVFEQYCKERYGSVQNALAFRQIHNWY